MDFAKVDVDVRQDFGKGSARRARARGRVPAVLYGRREAPIPISLDPLALVRSLDKERKRNTVFSLAVAGGGDGQTGSSGPITAMVREVQFDPISRNIIHVDFLRVSLDEEVKVSVPLVLKGTPVGVVNGGNLHHNVYLLPVAAKPADIPLRLECDVSALNIGQAVHVSDLKLPPGVRALVEPRASLASVVAPKAEKVEEAPAAALPGAEGAPAAAAGEGAAAAAGAPAGDKKEGEKGGKEAAPAKGKEAAAAKGDKSDKKADKKGK
jgi:large subunit ribosomal protein L25